MKQEWLGTDDIQRWGRISVEDFVRDFEELNRLVLLLGCLEDWLVLEKWDREYLIGVSGDIRFTVGPVDYFQYADSAKEERPLYLFDLSFTDKLPSLCMDYEGA
ncbi:F-box protein [Acorus gramineus]|uniref:F-box protein n=1 Tax=Acorus gramineus TaxID=55184 RepID=A0AAV9B5L1_ACOGR|nr:F-box protein [Acorus gramineus]